MLDFPNSPTVGQVFPSPNGVFSWDGAKWASLGNPSAGSAFVAKNGDTMTGSLGISPPSGWAQLILNKSASGLGNEIDSKNNGVMRWQLVPGNGNAETGVNTGSNFDISRYTDAGALIDTPFNINRASGAVRLKGTNTNDNAAAGDVGEWIESNLPWASNIGLSNGVAANATSIALTAGDWDVCGVVAFFGASTTTVASLYVSISQTSGTIVNNPVSCFGSLSANYNALFNGGVASVRAGPMRISLATAATIYLVAGAGFGTSTCQIYGANMNARRPR